MINPTRLLVPLLRVGIGYGITSINQVNEVTAIFAVLMTVIMTASINQLNEVIVNLL